MRNFVRGMGVGMIIATLVFAVAYMLIGNEISDAEIKQRAAKLGMIEEEQTVIKSDSVEESEGIQNSNAVSNSSVDYVQPEQQMQDSTVLPEATYETTGSAMGENYGEGVPVTINRGEDGISISYRLQELGIITDALDFNRYLSENRLQMNIMYGDYILQKNMPYEAIVEKIITR